MMSTDCLQIGAGGTVTIVHGNVHIVSLTLEYFIQRVSLTSVLNPESSDAELGRRVSLASVLQKLNPPPPEVNDSVHMALLAQRGGRGVCTIRTFVYLEGQQRWPGIRMKHDPNTVCAAVPHVHGLPQCPPILCNPIPVDSEPFGMSP